MIDPLTLPRDAKDVPPGLTPFVEQTCRQLVNRYGEWSEATDDEVVQVVFQALDVIIPRGDRLWDLMTAYPTLGRLPGPGAMADTIEEVVRDAIRESVEPAIFRWTDAVYDAEHPEDATEGEEGVRSDGDG